MAVNDNTGVTPAPRGFARMDSQRQKEVSSLGGRTAHARGNAHEFTAEEARLAGHKGGQVVSANREHMAAIGRIGGRRERKPNKAVESLD
ncbi:MULTISPECIES: stress-induced protein [Dyella]|uniref:Stress-induced protein n=2 Tax=Dyella TaxID=231454 RepID=A0A4R0YUF8_9GAMM|nr:MULTISPECIES: stress-induced protein [Dyella]TBR39493.1 stress-induced protein [Dyella terrae]TCI12922.1 stress-induced protein [Dyella soli]